MPLELFPYQRDGAIFLMRRDRAGLFDMMGLGKTATTIAALDAVAARRVLVICPAAVREVWRGELKKFAVRHRRIVAGRDIQDLNLWLKGKADVLLLSYEMATKWAPRLGGDIIDAIIFDEAHYLKSPDSSRTKALLGQRCDGADGLARWGAYVWFLTGTPNPNDAADLWSMMRFCRATALEREKFCTRYYKKWQGSYSARHDPKTDMLGELKQAVSSFSIRRTKRQVGLQLPPIWLTTTTVDGDTDEIRGLLREHPGLEDAILEAVERGGLSFLDAQHIATLRRLVGEAKAPAFANLLVEELNNGLDKVVVFGIHRRPMDHIVAILAKHGLKSVRIDGSTSERDRINHVRQFQEDPECRVFNGNIRAAGTGLTLHAAADVILFESDWSPAGNAQALMRVHRIGQERAVRARFITLAGSIDEHVSAVVARKTAAIARIEGQAEYGLTA